MVGDRARDRRRAWNGHGAPGAQRGASPGADPGDAARVLTARHVGITVALLLLAPIAANRLDDAIQHARDQEVAIMLDARLDPFSKIGLVGDLVGQVDAEDPRGDLDRSFATAQADISDENLPEFEAVRARADETVVAAVNTTFRPVFLIAAAFALAAAAVLFVPTRSRLLVVAAGCAAAVFLTTTAVAIAVWPTPVPIADPCEPRDLPDTGGITGFAQDAALQGLDAAACHFGSSREELVLALANEEDAQRYEEKYGVDPRSPSSLLNNLLEQVLP